MPRPSDAVRFLSVVSVVSVMSLVLGGASAMAVAPPAGGAAAATEPVALALDLQPGAPMRQRMSVVQSMKQESAASIPVELGSTIVLDVTHRVLDEPPTAGRFVVQTTIERVVVRVHQSIQASAVTMDSTRPESIQGTPMAAPFERLFAAVGTPIRWELTAAGQFVADDAVADVVIQRAGGTATPLRSFLRQMIRPVPDGPVAIGEPWTQTVPGKEIGRTEDLTLTWILTDQADQATRFRIRASERVVDEPVSVGPGAEGRMSRTGSTTGTATAARGGWIIALETRQTTEGSAEVPRGADMVEVTFQSSVKTGIRAISDDQWPEIHIGPTGEVLEFVDGR